MLVNSAPTDNAMITIFVEVSKIVAVSVVPPAPPVTYLLLLLVSCPRWCLLLLPAPSLGRGLHGQRWLGVGCCFCGLDSASWATELLSHAGHRPLDFDSGVLIKQTRRVSPRLARTAHWALVCPCPYTGSCSRGWTRGTEMVPEVETKVRMYRQRERQERDPAPFFLIVRANIEPGVAAARHAGPRRGLISSKLSPQ